MNTPGPLGYLLAWATSVVVFTGTLMFEVPNSPWQVLAGLVVYGGFIAVLSVPFAAAGILLVHHICRDERRQWCHVLVAGTAGAMTGGFLTLVSVGFVVLIPVIAASTALGRTVVIPLVWRRRNSARPATTG